MKKHLTDQLGKLVLSGAVAALPVVSALAQEDNANILANNIMPPPSPRQLGWEAGVDSGYDGGSSAKFQGQRHGDSDAFNLSVEAGVRIPLSETWFLNVKLAEANFFLDQVAGEPIPSSIQTLRLSANLGWRFNDHWTFTGLVTPSLYRFEDVGQSDLGIAGGVLAAYQMTPSVTWRMGVLVAPDSYAKVLPVVGVHWAVNDQVTLDVGIPKTRLTYQLASRWSVYGGAGMEGTIFRTSDALAPNGGNSRYNDALGIYRDIRAGVGTGYEFLPGLRAELEAGYSVYRSIDYEHLDTTVMFHPAPYARLGLILKF